MDHSALAMCAHEHTTSRRFTDSPHQSMRTRSESNAFDINRHGSRDSPHCSWISTLALDVGPCFAFMKSVSTLKSIRIMKHKRIVTVSLIAVPVIAGVAAYLV